MRINAFDDGLRPELLENAFFDGIFEIPYLKPLEKMIEPTGLIPFSKRNKDSSRFVHFYEHEAHYQKFTNHPENFISELSLHPGIISPDNSVLVEAPPMRTNCKHFLISKKCKLYSAMWTLPNSKCSMG